MDTISPERLSARLGTRDEPFLLDIRSESAFETWHSPWSDHAPVSKSDSAESDAAIQVPAWLPDDDKIVTICTSGSRYEAKTARLRELGYEARTLVGGLRGWSRLHRSATIDQAGPATLIQLSRPG